MVYVLKATNCFLLAQPYCYHNKSSTSLDIFRYEHFLQIWDTSRTFAISITSLIIILIILFAIFYFFNENRASISIWQVLYWLDFLFNIVELMDWTIWCFRIWSKKLFSTSALTSIFLGWIRTLERCFGVVILQINMFDFYECLKTFQRSEKS